MSRLTFSVKLLLRSHLHRAGLHMLGFRQIESQYTISIAGFGTLRIDRRGERKRLLENARWETIPVDSRILGNRELRLPFQRKCILLSSDFNILRVGTRHWNLEYEAIRRFVQIRS